MKKLIIIGASGFGREVAWLVERINAINKEYQPWNIVGFLDDDKSLWGTLIDDYKVLGGVESINSFPDSFFVCAVGASKTRKKIIDKCKSLCSEVKFATLIDPSVLISKRVNLGVGSIICAGTVITVDINIGEHVIINLDCTVGHDAEISDFVTLYPSVNISGITNIGDSVELGTGVQIIQGQTIGENTIVGAGAVIIKDLPANCTAVGSPAKPIKFHR